ncbi:MAG: S8 family serine peptidase, partial [Actinomycetota bacterium]|nr:S8 family serine peptidase [Actinomycetota bacterium]
MAQVGGTGARRVLAVVGLIVAVVAAMLPIAAGAQPRSGGRYIVVLRDDVADPDAAAAELARQHGLAVSHVYRHVLKGFAASVPAAAVRGLRNNPKVLSIDADLTVSIAQEVSALQTLSTGATLPTGVDRAGAEVAGAGVAVAVLDSGIATHPDLSLAGGYNCTSSDRSAWGDVHGHGTHVAGTIGANGKIVGVAPGTPLWAVKVLGDDGNGQWSWVICGIDWAAGQGITVGNMSLSGGSSENPSSCASSSLHQAICNAQSRGLRFAVAAGNSGADAGGYVPAKYPEVTAVSALADSNGCDGGVTGPTTSSGPDESRATFSNYGSVIDVAAPGVSIYSTVPGGYGTKSGTSMAAPHVAGLMARG